MRWIRLGIGLLGVGSFFLIFIGVGGIQHAENNIEIAIWFAVALIGALSTWVFSNVSLKEDE